MGGDRGARAIARGVRVCVGWLAARSSCWRWRVPGARPALALRPWTRADTIALCLVLLLVPALMGLPYRNLGRCRC